MSFFLYLVYLAVTFIRIDAILPDLVPYRPMLWLMLICLIAAVFSTLANREVSARPRHFLLLAAFVGTIAASQVANGWAGGAIQSISDFTPSAVIALLTWLNVTSMKRLRTACAVLVLSMLALAITGVISFHTGFMEDKFVLRQSGGDEAASMPVDPDSDDDEENALPGTFLRLRGIGFLNDPNDFAQAIVMTLPLLWGFAARRRPIRNILVIGFPVLAFLYAIFLTHSRGALVGLVVLLAFGVRKRLGNVKTVLLLGLLVAAAQLTDFSGGRDMSTQEVSAGDRIESWNVGIHLLQSHPVFGVGYGNYENFNQLTAHNSFVLCFTELGLVGFFIWMGLLVIAYKSTNLVANSSAPDSEDRTWGIGLRAALIGFLGCAWFLSRTYEPLLYLLIALCIASRYCEQPTVAAAAGSPLFAPMPWAKSTAVVCAVAISAAYATIVMQRILGH